MTLSRRNFLRTAALAPLAVPAGALSIDTTHLSLAEVVKTMAVSIAARLGQ